MAVGFVFVVQDLTLTSVCSRRYLKAVYYSFPGVRLFSSRDFFNSLRFSLRLPGARTAKLRLLLPRACLRTRARPRRRCPRQVVLAAPSIHYRRSSPSKESRRRAKTPSTSLLLPRASDYQSTSPLSPSTSLPAVSSPSSLRCPPDPCPARQIRVARPLLNKRTIIAARRSSLPNFFFHHPSLSRLSGRPPDPAPLALLFTVVLFCVGVAALDALLHTTHADHPCCSKTI